jgi:hypothetical protein
LLRHLRRGRQHARQDADDRGPHPAQHGLTALAHLTCVNHTRDEVRALLEKIRALGCKNILALRGDPPGGGEFQPTPGGFEFSPRSSSNSSANRAIFPSASPVFPKATSPAKNGKHADWRHLKEKVDAGADFVLTQLFFDNADYFEFRDYVAGKLGVKRAARAGHRSHFERDANHEIHPALRRKNSAAAARKTG